MSLLCSIVVALISYFLFKRTGADMNPRGLNMLSWIYYVQFICFSLVGATCVVYNVDDHYVISSILHNSDEIRVMGWMLVLYAMIAFPCGILITKKLFINRKGILMPVVPCRLMFSYPLLYFFTVVSIASCIYVLYVSQYIGALNIISGAVSAQDRINYTRHFIGNEYVRNILAQTLSVLLSMMWYIECKIAHKIRDKYFFYITLFFAVLMMTQSYAKSPIINLFISFIMLKVFLFGRLSRKVFVTVVFLSCVGIVLMYIKTAAMDLSMILSGYNKGVLGRVFFTQIAGLFKTLEFFPSEHDFINFSSISMLITRLFGSEYIERSARIVMTLFNPNGVIDGTAGVMNTLFIAEAWANWGIVGVLFSPWITGIITGFIYYITIHNKNLMYAAAYGYLSIRIPVTGGFNDFIYPVGLVMPFIFIFFITHIKMKKALIVQNAQFYCDTRAAVKVSIGDRVE